MEDFFGQKTFKTFIAQIMWLTDLKRLAMIIELGLEWGIMQGVKRTLKTQCIRIGKHSIWKSLALDFFFRIFYELCNLPQCFNWREIPFNKNTLLQIIKRDSVKTSIIFRNTCSRTNFTHSSHFQVNGVGFISYHIA